MVGCHKLPAAPGFEKPSAIQQKGIVPFGKGLDVIQQAQSGTGKTATFCTGILQNMDYNLLETQALVLAPTRELAQQIETVMRALGDFQQVQSNHLTWQLQLKACQQLRRMCFALHRVTPGPRATIKGLMALSADSCTHQAQTDFSAPGQAVLEGSLTGRTWEPACRPQPVPHLVLTGPAGPASFSLCPKAEPGSDSWLHAGQVPCLRGRHQRARGPAHPAAGCACGGRHPGPRV